MMSLLLLEEVMVMMTRRSSGSRGCSGRRRRHPEVHSCTRHNTRHRRHTDVPFFFLSYAFRSAGTLQEARSHTAGGDPLCEISLGPGEIVRRRRRGGGRRPSRIHRNRTPPRRPCVCVCGYIFTIYIPPIDFPRPPFSSSSFFFFLPLLSPLYLCVHCGTRTVTTEEEFADRRIHLNCLSLHRPD